MNALFICLGTLLLLQSALALAATLRLAHYALHKAPRLHSRYQPRAAVIVPCKGVEHDFEENIRALLVQDYRDYEIIFVTESKADPAYQALARILKQSRRAAWMVVSGPARERGQKVHNLLAAIETLDAIDRRAEILVFADSDARATRQWLAELVAPLGDKRIGATTGFRWYLPLKSEAKGKNAAASKRSRSVQGGLAPILLSVWNASAVSLLGERSSFAWGGSLALRRESFERFNIATRWQGAVSDDYVITAALQQANRRIKFVPECLVASHADATWRSLLEFSTRQMRITRVYAPRVWQLACTSHVLFNLTFWGGLCWAAGSYVTGRAGTSELRLLALLAAVFAFGTLTGAVRGMVAGRLLTTNFAEIQRLWWAYALLGPAASLLYLYNAIASAVSKRITWRGISYEMVSPRETVILSRTVDYQARSATQRTSRPKQARSSSKKVG